MAQRAVHIESLTTSDVSEPALAEALALANHYSLLAPAGKHVVRCIHAVRELYDFAVEPGQLEFYLGRTGATARHVLSRFRHHWESKEMTAGTVVFRCNTSDVMGWEKAAVRVLLGLRGRERLCVRNVAADARGALPASDESAVYLTWRVLDDIKPITPPVRRDISVLAHELSSQLDGISRDTLERVLDPVTRPATEQADLAWFEGHRRPACDEAAGR